MPHQHVDRNGFDSQTSPHRFTVVCCRWTVQSELLCWPWSGTCTWQQTHTWQVSQELPTSGDLSGAFEACQG